jgi:manganese oxidase
MLADNPGDWAFHCHKSHHTMNAMGHDMRNMIGVSHKDLAKAVGKLAPDAMVMGSTGMSMGNMEMPAPDNTLPMMTGTGQFGPIEMGGMFTVMKIREGMARDDYSDPGPYKFPQGTVAWEVDAPAAAPARQDTPAASPPATKGKDHKSMHKGMKM